MTKFDMPDLYLACSPLLLLCFQPRPPKPKLHSLSLSSIHPGRPPPRGHRADVLRVGRGRQTHQPHRHHVEAEGEFFCFYSFFFFLFFFSPFFSLFLSLSHHSLFLSPTSSLIPTIKVSDPTCCDYDKRTPLHLAASEGCYKVTEWLLEQGADVNAVDRFRRTPLEEAVRGDFAEVAKLLIDKGGKIQEGGKVSEVVVEERERTRELEKENKGKKLTFSSSSFFRKTKLIQLIALNASSLAGVTHLPSPGLTLDTDWEIEPTTLELGAKLGEGEFGVVYRALWHGTAVAAKVLKASSDIALGDFRSEIEVLRKVHHPNAVQFLGACTKKEPYILVTELMSGGSLADAMRPGMGFPARRALEVAADAARGLAYLHARKQGAIVHRDLKPGNLMISGTQYLPQARLVSDIGTVKLADFGLSKSLPKADKHAGYDLDSKFKLTGETGSYR